MLIVSQNKEKIVNIDNCVDISLVKEYGQDEEIDIVKYVNIIYKGSYRGDLLGYYKTEERAKEVLQEIISCYSDTEGLKCIVNINGCLGSKWLNELAENSFIYEMPKE